MTPTGYTASFEPAMRLALAEAGAPGPADAPEDIPVGAVILDEAGVEFVVVSGDMIEGTITATLLERMNPGAIGARKEAAGRLYNVSEFAAEVAAAAVEPIPADHTRLVGDVSDFEQNGV